MLKISTKGQYALLLMTDLAEQDPSKYVALKILSHRHNLSIKYAEQILMQLSKTGLVVGLRGNNGGYRAGEILRAMEGNLSPKGVSEGNTVSSVGNDAFWQGFDEAVNHYVDSITLEQIAEKNREFNGFDYVI